MIARALAFLNGLAVDLLASLSVPARHGRWDLH